MSASDDIRILQKQVYDLQTSYSAPVTNSLGANVLLNNTALYFDGPSVAQGSTGIWYVTTTFSLVDPTAGNNYIYAKLWDGTTVIASAQILALNTTAIPTTLAGFITNPAGNLRISCRDISTTAGYFIANGTGLGKDSTITAFRIG